MLMQQVIKIFKYTSFDVNHFVKLSSLIFIQQLQDTLH